MGVATARALSLRTPARACLVGGCLEIPTEGKPYCVDHLARLPYVDRLQESLARRRAEIARASRPESWTGIDVRGVVAKEILDEIGPHGAMTPERLAQRVAIPRRALSNYLLALERAGLVEIGMVGERRRTVVLAAGSLESEANSR